MLPTNPGPGMAQGSEDADKSMHLDLYRQHQSTITATHSNSGINMDTRRMIDMIAFI
jgi:hypothetical protein